MSFNIPYLVGDKLGRDHIQWPTILRAGIDAVRPGLTDDQKDEIWPMDITLAQIIAFCWRVRRWELSGSIAASKSITFGLSTNTVSGTATVDATEIVTRLNGVEAVSERDLIGRVFDDSTNARTMAYKSLVNDGLSVAVVNDLVSDWETTGDLNGDFSGFAVINFSGLFGYHLFDEATRKFAPPLDGFGFLIPNTLSDNQLQVTLGFNRSPVTVLSGATPTILKVPLALTVSPGIAPSFDFPMQLAWRLTSEVPGGTVIGSGSGAFTLTAVKFWAHTNTLGQPIYDEDTGAPTGNDPLA